MDFFFVQIIPPPRMLYIQKEKCDILCQQFPYLYWGDTGDSWSRELRQYNAKYKNVDFEL